AAGDSTARAGITRGSTARAKSRTSTRTSIRTRSRTACRTDPTSTVYTGLGGKQTGDHRPERGECALRPRRVVVGGLDADRGGAVRVPEGQAGRGRGARVAPRGADPGAGRLAAPRPPPLACGGGGTRGGQVRQRGVEDGGEVRSEERRVGKEGSSRWSA